MDASLAQNKIKAALKQVLKKQNHTYADLAKVWGCSVPTVKRQLGPEEMPLSRLLTALEWLDLTLSDLHKIAESEELEAPKYTQRQNEFLAKNGGWTMVTNQVSPLGAPDYSSYLTNIANSGAEVLVNVNWGHDAVLSTQQAKQFGLLPKMKLVIPYQIPFLAREVGPEVTEGVYAATDFWWTLEDKFPLAKMFVETFEKKFGYKPEWGAENAYMEFALWAEAVEHAGTFYPPDVIKSYESPRKLNSFVGEVSWRPEDHQLVRPVVIVRGKKPSEMRNKQDFWEVVEVVPGAGLMQKPDAFGCNLGSYT